MNNGSRFSFCRVSVYANYICDFCNGCTDQDNLQTLYQTLKRDSEIQNTIISQWTVFQLFQKYLRKFYINSTLSKFYFGFRKGYDAQGSFLPMLKYWKRAVDKRKFLGTLLIELSKAFDCLSDKPMIATSNAYGFSLFALTLIQYYLSKRQ